jgi:PAS domain S-box-containing protein
MGLDGRYYDYHSPRKDLLAAAPETLLGKLVSEVMPPDAAETVQTALREAFEKGTSSGRQIRLLLAGGQTWFELSVARKATAADAPPRFVVLSRDITARKQSEMADAFLAQAGIDPDGEPFFAALARFLATSLEMDYICIDRLEGDQLTATTVAVWHDGGFEDNVSYALADTPCGQVPGQKVCCYPASVSTFFPKDAALQELQAESYLGVPLLSHTGVPIGLIAVIGRSPLVDQTRAELLLARVAPRAAAELERLTIEISLRDSEARFRSMFEQAPIGVAEVDSTSGAILTVNLRFADIIGISTAELTTLKWNSFANPGDIPEGLDLLERMKAGAIHGFELDKHHRRPDGSHIWIHLTIAPVIEGGDGNARHLCMVQDISERKQTEEALRASHAILSKFNALAVGRELRMIELKSEINELCAKLGQPPRHRIVASSPGQADAD